MELGWEIDIKKGVSKIKPKTSVFTLGDGEPAKTMLDMHKCQNVYP